MNLAEPFATSTAGYFTSFGIVAVVGMVAWTFKRFFAKLDEFGKTQSEHTRALTLLVDRDLVVRPTLVNLDNRATAQEVTTAALKAAMDQHMDWAGREAELLRRAQSPPAGPNPL